MIYLLAEEEEKEKQKEIGAKHLLNTFTTNYTTSFINIIKLNSMFVCSKSFQCFLSLCNWNWYDK